MGSLSTCCLGEDDRHNEMLTQKPDHSDHKAFESDDDQESIARPPSTQPNQFDTLKNIEELNDDSLALPSSRPTGVSIPEIGTELAYSMLTNAIAEETEAIRLKNGGQLMEKLLKRYSPVITTENYLYIGEIDGNFKRSGYGILYTNTCLLEGTWVNNKLTGQGILVKDNFKVYQGHFSRNRLTKGVFKKDGYEYAGEFKDLKQHGQGEEKKADGSLYIGLFAEGLRHGQGKFVDKDKVTYEGLFDKGDLANGICQFKNGSKYKGAFKHYLMDGFGKLMDIEGPVYEGLFMAGKKHGQGKMLNIDGTVVEGIWVEDKLHSKKLEIDTLGRIKATS